MSLPTIHGESTGTQNSYCQLIPEHEHEDEIPRLAHDTSSTSPPPPLLITPPTSHTYTRPHSSSSFLTSVSKRSSQQKQRTPDPRATLLEFLENLNKRARAQSRAIREHERDLENFVEANEKRFRLLEGKVKQYREVQRNLKKEVEQAVERQSQQLLCRKEQSPQGLLGLTVERDDIGGTKDDEILVGSLLEKNVGCGILVDVDGHDYELQQNLDTKEQISSSILSRTDNDAIVSTFKRGASPLSENEYFTPPPFVNDNDNQEEIIDFPSQNSYEYQPLLQASDKPSSSKDEEALRTESIGAQAICNSLIQEAIDREMVRLGGQNVLQEGESVVDFHMRKRLQRIERDLSQGEDWSFLGWPYNQQIGDDDNFSVPSRLSSGIETPPESDTQSTSYNQQIATSAGEDATTNQVYEPLLSIPMSRQSSAAQTTASLRLRRERRGGSLIEDKLLAPSDGRPGNGANWPRYSKNTIKARMSEIECDSCGGRVHFVCAGLDDSKDMRSEPWCCPECIEAISEQALLEEEGKAFEPILKAQRDRCLRPKCIYRSYAKIIKKNKDDDEFFLERIIGRERLGRNVKGRYIYKYLVKWYDWEAFDSTWEPAQSIPDIEREEQLFLHAATKADLDVHWKFIFLPEASMWFDEKGRYKIELLQQLGVEDRSWWYEH